MLRPETKQSQGTHTWKQCYKIQRRVHFTVWSHSTQIIIMMFWLKSNGWTNMNNRHSVWEMAIDAKACDLDSHKSSLNWSKYSTVSFRCYSNFDIVTDAIHVCTTIKLIESPSLTTRRLNELPQFQWKENFTWNVYAMNLHVILANDKNFLHVQKNRKIYF